MGVAVSSGTSCLKPTGPAGAKVGSIAGTVINSQQQAIGAGVTVTATVDATSLTYTGTTAADGSFLISSVPDGAGTIVLSGLPSNCTAPPAVTYTLNGRGTITENIGVSCTP